MLSFDGRNVLEWNERVRQSRGGHLLFTLNSRGQNKFVTVFKGLVLLRNSLWTSQCPEQQQIWVWEREHEGVRLTVTALIRTILPTFALLDSSLIASGISLPITMRLLCTSPKANKVTFHLKSIEVCCFQAQFLARVAGSRKRRKRRKNRIILNSVSQETRQIC